MNTPSENCCGCSACKQICPVQAIKMQENEKGFYAPIIDSDKCINCGQCVKVCPQENELKVPDRPIRSVAIKSISDEIRKRSTSGGAFTILSDWILSKNGLIFGTVYDDAFKATIVQADNAEDRNRMRGSKYVESDVSNSFFECSIALQQKKYVLFTGTPCQIAGLNNYLNSKEIDKEYLITCQIVCHGVPSPRLFADHIQHLQTTYKQQIVEYYHRPKVWGWHEHNEMACFQNGKKVHQSKASQNHKDLFYSGYSLRECCFTCKYAGNCGTADVTIGDFWGIEHIMPELDNNDGTSILLINTEKGDNMLKQIPDEVAVIKDIRIDDALRYNHIHPSKKPAMYEQFWNEYNKIGFRAIARKYASDKYPYKIIYYGKKWLRRALVKLRIIGY